MEGPAKCPVQHTPGTRMYWLSDSQTTFVRMVSNFQNGSTAFQKPTIPDLQYILRPVGSIMRFQQ